MSSSGFGLGLLILLFFSLAPLDKRASIYHFLLFSGDSLDQGHEAGWEKGAGDGFSLASVFSFGHSLPGAFHATSL